MRNIERDQQRELRQSTEGKPQMSKGTAYNERGFLAGIRAERILPMTSEHDSLSGGNTRRGFLKAVTA
jgi:hypothetical protein